MPLSTYYKNKCLDVLRAQTFTGITTTYVSAHDADPGDTGANEISGGSPAYARKSTTWNAAAAGSIDNSNAPVLDIPAGTTLTHLGLWDASTNGNFLGSASIPNEVFAGQGTYTVSDFDVDLNA